MYVIIRLFYVNTGIPFVRLFVDQKCEHLQHLSIDMWLMYLGLPLTSFQFHPYDFLNETFYMLVDLFSINKKIWYKFCNKIFCHYKLYPSLSLEIVLFHTQLVDKFVLEFSLNPLLILENYFGTVLFAIKYTVTCKKLL